MGMALLVDELTIILLRLHIFGQRTPLGRELAPDIGGYLTITTSTAGPYPLNAIKLLSCRIHGLASLSPLIEAVKP